MTTKKLHNVVFDIGNVIVRWAPQEIIRLTFGDDAPLETLARRLFQNEIWMSLNKGLLSEAEAATRYQAQYPLSAQDCARFFYYVKHTQLLLYGSLDLLMRVKKAGYRVYALTDNVHEIVAYLQTTYDFWPLFDGTVVSADLGVMKPSPEIYQALLTRHHLQATETVFLDDMAANVQGAQALGITAIRFKNAAQGERELNALGLSF